MAGRACRVHGPRRPADEQADGAQEGGELRVAAHLGVHVHGLRVVQVGHLVDEHVERAQGPPMSAT
jgi:hypothetical protein